MQDGPAGTQAEFRKDNFMFWEESDLNYFVVCLSLYCLLSFRYLINIIIYVIMPGLLIWHHNILIELFN